jgi:phage terminase large subunit-like protein
VIHDVELGVAPAWAEYAAGSKIDHFQWWCAEHCRHGVGPFSGRPLELEPWQVDFFGEGLAVDDDDLPYWKTVVMVVSRKNGKTTGTGGLGSYFADQEEETPIIGLAATSDEQASELFDAIGAFIGASPYLTERFHIRDYEGEIARTDAGAFLRRIRMDWRRLHGKNLLKLIADEIHAWSTPNLRKCWEALTTGDGARPGFQTWCITTEGEEDEGDEVSILRMIVDANEAYGDVERRGGLTISRDHDSRTLVYRYSASMPQADPQPVRDLHRRWSEAKREGRADVAELRAEYEAAVRRCVAAVQEANPASWITDDFIARKIVDPKITRAAFLRFHACVAVTDDEVWIQRTEWDACADESVEEIPLGERIQVGADGALTGDCSAVGWAWRLPDDRIAVGAFVWAAHEDMPAHLHMRGRIDNRLMKPFVLERLVEERENDVAEFVYDQRFLETIAADLSDAGLIVAPAWSAGELRAKAWQAWQDGILNRTIAHAGDKILAQHVCGAKALKTDLGWKVSKVSQRRKIDAKVAMAMAHYRCLMDDGGGFFLY